MSLDKEKIAKYVDAATDLAESVIQDIKRDGYVSNHTVHKVNGFSQAAKELQGFLDLLEQSRDKSSVKH